MKKKKISDKLIFNHIILSFKVINMLNKKFFSFSFSYLLFFLCWGIGINFFAFSFNQFSNFSTEWQNRIAKTAKISPKNSPDANSQFPNNFSPFAISLKNFLQFQGASAQILYHDLVANPKFKQEINQTFTKYKGFLQFIPANSSLIPEKLSCNGMLWEKISGVVDFDAFVNDETACFEKIVFNLVNEDNNEFYLSLESFFPIDLKKRKKSLSELRKVLEKIKLQLLWKFFKSQNWKQFKVNTSQWQNIDFALFQTNKALAFSQLSVLLKKNLEKLLTKIKQLKIKSNWQNVLDQELFSPQDQNNSSSLALILGLSLGGVFFFSLLLMSFYFYKSKKKKQKNV